MAKTLVDILAELDAEKSFDEVTTKGETSEVISEKTLEGISPEKKHALVFDMKMRGIAVNAIAERFRVDVSTIYRWLNKYTEDCRKRLEQQPAANLVAETIEYYERLEGFCLYEANQLTEEEKLIDSGGKVHVVSNSCIKETKLKFLQTAAKLRRLKTDLLTSTGVIPKEPSRIYHKMEEEKRAEEGEATGEERSKDQVKQDIIRLLERGRQID